ncbi:MAG: hypothetical protein V3V14_05300 [Saprospiraceae bacterium]
MFFKDISGKIVEKNYLRSNIIEGRMAHAQIFLGRKGSGQLSLALAYASFLLCTDRTETESCGVCSACIKSHKYIHPDIHFAYPVVKKDGKDRKETTSNDFLKQWRSAISDNPYMDMTTWLTKLHVENGQANINVKECVDIVKKLSLKTFESEYKILILWMPEYLRNEGNRLLKLIEEPPGNSIIILVAENQEEILNTILSRTQLLKVPPFTDEEVAQYLQSNFRLDQASTSSISGLAAGNMDAAINLANQENNNFAASLFKWLRIAYKMEPVELGKWVGEIAGWGRENQKHFLEYGLHYFREYLFQMLTGQVSKRLNEEELATAKKMASLLDISKTENLISVLNDCIALVSRNANSKILFMTESLKIGRIMRNVEEEKSIYNV